MKPERFKPEKLRLVFGGLCPRISEQLAEQGLRMVGGCATVQQDADALDRLAIRRLLTETEAHRARVRLLRQIAKQVEWAKVVKMRKK